MVVPTGSGSIGRAIARRVAPGRSLLVADLRADSVQTAAEGFLNFGFAADTTPAREPAELPLLTPMTDSGYAHGLAKQANTLRTQSAAPQWGDRGARVNSISPGIIMTPLARDETDGPGAAGCQAMINNSPAKRVGTPEEIADAAAFMMGATFLTGTDLLIDGGAIAAMAGGRITSGADPARWSARGLPNE